MSQLQKNPHNGRDCHPETSQIQKEPPFPVLISLNNYCKKEIWPLWALSPNTTQSSYDTNRNKLFHSILFGMIAFYLVHQIPT